MAKKKEDTGECSICMKGKKEEGERNWGRMNNTLPLNVMHVIYV